MLLLLAAILSCALAQSTTGTTLINITSDIRPLTVNQAPVPVANQPGDDSAFLFVSGVLQSNYLRRTTDSQANGEPVQTLLSHPNSVMGGGVGEAVLSPDDSYVLFSSAKDQQGSFQHYSVGVSGGTITRVTPSTFHQSFTTAAITWNFVPCQTGAARSDFFWNTFRTALRTNENDGAFEIWRNTRTGDAKRISVALGQQQDSTAPVKNLVVGPAFYDYIFYSVNPGPDNSNPPETTGNAPRNVYMADWNGNNWQLNAVPTVALGNSTAVTYSRSRPGCGQSGPGRYMQVADPITVVNIPSIYVYDVNNKARVGGAAVSPAGAGPCLVGQWMPDESGVTFQCTVTPATAAPADNNVDLYFFKTTGTAAATKISLAYPTANRGFAVAGLTIQGDYLVWTQVTAAPALQSIVSYNWKTGAAATALFTETANVTLTGAALQFADVESSGFTDNGAGMVGSGNTPSVWFTVTDSTSAPAKTSVYRAALAGAAGSTATQIADTLAVTGLQARLCGPCSTSAATDTCKAGNRGCQGVTCGCSKCSGWATFLGRTVASPQWQIYSVAHSGGAVVVTALATTECTAGSPVVPAIWTRTVGHPFTNSLRPFVYFTQTTGVPGSEVQSLHAVQAGSATVINFTPNPVARGFVIQTVAGITGSSLCVPFQGTHNSPVMSGNNRWILYQSQTVTNGLGTPLSKPVAETFLAIADGSVAPRKVGPALDADHTGGGFPIMWTRDSAFALFGVLDQTSTATAFFARNRQRDQLWSVEASTDTAPKTYNLTTISNVPLVNSVNDMGTPAFHPCNHRRLVYTTRLPEEGSPRQIYSVLVTGGNTVRLSFDPNSAVPVAGFIFTNTREAVAWSAPYYFSTPDIFLNRASASMFAPMIALLALMIALLH